MKLRSFFISALVVISGIGSSSAGAADRRSIVIDTKPPLEGVLVVEPAVERVRRQPVVLLLGGFETGKQAVDLVKGVPGFALAGVDYPYRQEGKWTFETFLSRGKELRSALHATRDGLCRLIQTVRADPRVRERELVILGASFGVPFALHAARDCGPVSALILVHGFGDLPGTLAYRMNRRYQRNFGETFGPLLANASAQLLWQMLGFEKPEDVARGLPSGIPVLWIEAQDDEMIPASSRTVLREALAASGSKMDTQILPGRHLHPRDTGMIRDLIQRSWEWLVKKGIQ